MIFVCNWKSAGGCYWEAKSILNICSTCSLNWQSLDGSKRVARIEDKHAAIFKCLITAKFVKDMPLLLHVDGTDGPVVGHKLSVPPAYFVPACNQVCQTEGRFGYLLVLGFFVWSTSHRRALTSWIASISSWPKRVYCIPCHDHETRKYKQGKTWNEVSVSRKLRLSYCSNSF